MKKVLIVSYYFPPVGGGGVQRTSKFVKYLPIYGWRPFVLTAKEEVYHKTNRPMDKTLLDDIPKDIKIYRTRSFDLLAYSKGKAKKGWRSEKRAQHGGIWRKILGIIVNPDAQMFWIPTAAAKGLRLIIKEKIDAVYSTGNPWTNLIVGVILKKIARRPLIADFRDPWTLNPFCTYSTKFRYAIQRNLEKRTFESADKVIFTSNRTLEDYRKVFNVNKYVTITNGFDEDDFATVRRSYNRRCNFLYAGNILADFKSPVYFIRAVSKFLQGYPEARKEITINFLGKIDIGFKKFVQQKNLEDVIEILGYRSHRESVVAVVNAHILLLIRGKEGKMIIPGKLFEYFASGKPILALIPSDGSAADLLREEDRDEFIVDPEDMDGIAKKIEVLFRLYKKRKLPSYHVNNLNRYTRKKLTERFVGVLNEVVKSQT